MIFCDICVCCSNVLHLRAYHALRSTPVHVGCGCAARKMLAQSLAIDLVAAGCSSDKEKVRSRALAVFLMLYYACCHVCCLTHRFAKTPQNSLLRSHSSHSFPTFLHPQHLLSMTQQPMTTQQQQHHHLQTVAQQQKPQHKTRTLLSCIIPLVTGSALHKVLTSYGCTSPYTSTTTIPSEHARLLRPG